VEAGLFTHLVMQRLPVWTETFGGSMFPQMPFSECFELGAQDNRASSADALSPLFLV